MYWDDADIDEIKQRAQKLARNGEISGRAMFYLQQGHFPKERVKKKLRCDTEGCGFVGDLLVGGRAIDDISLPTEKRTELYRISKDTWECPACGAPLER